MWKSVFAGLVIAAIAIGAFLAIGCATIFGPAICAIDHSKQASAPTVQSPARHDTYVREGAPDPYRDKQNPMQPTIGNIVEGARLYDLRCAVCHGMMGVGDGQGGAGLPVQPADLGRSLGQPLYKDDFFYWSISEGGGAFGSDMPPFKQDLSDRDIWRILVFMRASFAEQGTKDDAGLPP